MGMEAVCVAKAGCRWYSIMGTNKVLPGPREVVRHMQLDESRQMAYGVFLLSRLIAEDESLFEIVEEVMDEMLEYLGRTNAETEERIGEIPFDFDYEQVMAFGTAQYERRMARISKAKGKTLEEIYRSGKAQLDDDDAE